MQFRDSARVHEAAARRMRGGKEKRELVNEPELGSLGVVGSN